MSARGIAQAGLLLPNRTNCGHLANAETTAAIAPRRPVSVAVPVRRSPFADPTPSPQTQPLEGGSEKEAAAPGRGPLPSGANAGAPPSSNPLNEQARELLKELTEAFRERQQFGSGGTRSPSGVAVERIKLLATFFNTVAAGLLTAGLIGPMAAYLYGFSSSARSTLEITEGIVIVFLLSVLSHLAGRSVLGRLAS